MPLRSTDSGCGSIYYFVFLRRAIAVSLVLLTAAVGTAAAQLDSEVGSRTPDCREYKATAKKAYALKRWWRYADATPARKGERRRMHYFVRKGCHPGYRKARKQEYWRFYRKTIAPCKYGGERFANCAVAACESGYGHAGSYTYGFTVYWTAIGPLPKWGNHSRTGTRFAPSEPASTHIENNVFAAAAFKFGPTPATCAS